jgi:tRNA(Arg) A34 adenosine deaminase TadA
MTQKQDITAIIYDKRGRVLSIGRNSYCKSNPLQKLHADKVGLPEKIFLHAEIHAIVKLRDHQKPYKMFVSRVLKDGSFGNAKPCLICQSAIKACGIKEVEFT